MNRTKKSKSRTAPSVSGGFSDLLKHSAIGTATAILFAALLAILGTALCLLSDNPGALAIPVGLIALYLSAIGSGMITARLHKNAVLWCGLLSGGMLAVFFWFLTLFFPHGTPNFPLPFSLLLRVGTVGVSILGALLSLKRKPTRRHKRRN